MDEAGIGRWLRRKLRAHNMTQAELVRRTGFSSAFVSQLVNGQRDGREPDTRRQIAKAFGLTLSEMDAEIANLPPPPKLNATQRAIMQDQDLSPDQRQLMLRLYEELRRQG